jgi:hypothetical protein
MGNLYLKLQEKLLSNKNYRQQLEFRCVRSTNNETPVEPFDKLRAGLANTYRQLWSYRKVWSENSKRI